ncbi:MAG: hypothetical protein ACOVRM_19110, partial [Planctomycetaceae bacterium]
MESGDWEVWGDRVLGQLQQAFFACRVRGAFSWQQAAGFQTLHSTSFSTMRHTCTSISFYSTLFVQTAT